MPGKITGFSAYEEAGVMAVNLRAVRKLSIETMPDIVFEMELGYSKVSGGAKGIVSYWRGLCPSRSSTGTLRPG